MSISCKGYSKEDIEILEIVNYPGFYYLDIYVTLAY